MIKRILVIVMGMSMLIGSVSVQAQSCTTLPYTLTNGTTADASQVMANYNYLINCFVNPTFGGTVTTVDTTTLANAAGKRVLINSSATPSFGTGNAGNVVYVGSAVASGLLLGNTSGTQRAFFADDGTTTTFGNSYSGTLAFYINGSPRMTLSSTNFDVLGQLSSTQSSAGVESLFLQNSATSGNNFFTRFYTEASPTERGSIIYNRGAGLVQYNTTSDYRAKDVFGLFSNAGKIIDAIPVYLGQMKGAAEKRPMVVAHEVQKVAPWAVTGEKDAMDKEGKPVMQQLSQGALVELLLAEIQDLRKRLARVEGWTQR